MGGNLTDNKEEFAILNVGELETIKLKIIEKTVIVPKFVEKEFELPVLKEKVYEKPILKEKEYIIPVMKESDLLAYLKIALPPLLKQAVKDIVNDLKVELQASASLNLKVK